MELALQTFISRCVALADIRNLSDDNPIMLRLENPNNNSRTMVVVAFNEPYNYPLPLNVTWINVNPSSVFYNTALKRSSKQQSSQFQHTWDGLYYLNDVFVPDQYYEPGDDPGGITEQEVFNHINSTQNPHATTAVQTGALPLAGGTLTGPALARTLGAGEDWAGQELIPRIFVESALQPLATALTTLTSRVDALYSDDPTDNPQFTAIANELAGIHQDIINLQDQISNGGGGGTNAGMTHNQSVANTSWNVVHNLASLNVVTQVLINNLVVVPSSISIVDLNNITITFSEPTVGRALIIKVG